MSPCSYAATTATSQVIVLTKQHFLALSNKKTVAFVMCLV
jgi:hypothetical protein